MCDIILLMKGLKYWLLGLVMASCLVLGCNESSPFYGTWADNLGNSFTFNDDGSLNARVASSIFDGSYSILLNALKMDVTNVVTGKEQRVITEWDIRGNFMYFDFPIDDGETLFLRLGKVSN
jgi:hypothetical protein